MGEKGSSLVKVLMKISISGTRTSLSRPGLREDGNDGNSIKF